MKKYDIYGIGAAIVDTEVIVRPDQTRQPHKVMLSTTL